LKSISFVAGKPVLALPIVFCLAAGGLGAAESVTVSSSPKPATHTVTHTAATPNHVPPAKKAIRSSGTHSAYHASTTSKRTAAPHAGATHSAAGKAPVHAYTARTAGKAPYHPGAYASQHRTAPAHTRYVRPTPVTALNGWQRLARLHLQPERVQEIQQALIREGYLQGEPSGLWDTRTHDAMLHFQTDHGFPATGLPEAKSLMKLGLGSHPLPPDLDHGPAAAPAAGAAESSLPAPVASPPVSEVTPPSQ
jgi:hypothetical protein